PANASGQYSFDAVPLGKYTVSVTMQGFRKFSSSGNELQVGEPLTIDVTLAPGVVSDEVTVVATSVQVQTAEASLGNVLDPKPIEDLPLNGLVSNTLPSDASAVCTWTLVATTVTSSETTP